MGRDLASKNNFVATNADARELARIVDKLENLRGDPSVADKMGPWYHGFGVLFISSLVGRPGGITLTDAEHFTRLFGLGGSRVDKEKIAWDEEMILAVGRIHKLIYDEKPNLADKKDAKKLQECPILLAEVKQLTAAGKLTEAQAALAKVQKECSGLTPNTAAGLDDVRLGFERAVESIIDEAKSERDNCRYKEALQKAEEAASYLPNLSWLTTNLSFLREQAAAQEEAQKLLRPGLEAIKRKDLDGAINSIREAQKVPKVPPCLSQQMAKTLSELEQHKKFIKLTEQVEEATRKCDYKEASRLVGEITRIAPREQFMTDWINLNVPKLADLQQRERQAINLIKKAEAGASQAELVAATEPVDTGKTKTLVQQAMNDLIQADKDAPQCLPERKQMEPIRQRLANIGQRKKSQIASSIVLLIDTSGSMADNNKINQAKDAARRAARQVSKTTEIAILQFDGGCSPSSMRPAAGFTTDLNTLLIAIDGLQPGGGTPMYISTAAAVKYAQDNAQGAVRTVILMSDGGDSCRSEQAQAAASIRSSNIPVSTIGFDVGNNQQAQGDLGNLATMTGGRTFSASAADPREIIRAFTLAMLPSLLKDLDFGSAGSNLSGYFSQAKSLVQQQDISGALMMLQQANQVAPNSPNLNFNLSLLYEAEDQLTPALNHANNYLRLAPSAVDRADVENRIGQIQQELQRNPRIIMDSSGCRDILTWSQAEKEAARRSKDAGRIQAILDILISSQRGHCDKARAQADSYKGRYR
jgi:Mg-chelatase subunit ChlD